MLNCCACVNERFGNDLDLFLSGPYFVSPKSSATFQGFYAWGLRCGAGVMFDM
jgi:hypothetical protein